MLVEAYTKDGQECSWTLDDVNAEALRVREEEPEKFTEWYNENLQILEEHFLADIFVRGNDPFNFDGGDGSPESVFAHHALKCYILNLQHDPLWRSCKKDLNK